MNLQEIAIAKIQQMPEDLVQEVNNFIDSLLMRHRDNNREWLLEFEESLDITESDFSDYLSNLEDYEQRLASGEIKW